MRARSFLLLGLGTLWALSAAGAETLYTAPKTEPVAPGVWRLRFGVPEPFTPEKFRERAPALDGFSHLPEPGQPPFPPESVRCRIAPSRTVVHVPCDEPGEELYGFGLDPACFKQKGLRKWLTVSAAKMGETGASHGPVPFYLSTRGYGVYVDTARVPAVHVARLDNRPATRHEDGAADAPATSTEALYTARKTPRGPEVVFDLPGNASGVDVYLFAGPSIRDAVQRYNLFSGGGCMPPLWGLGMKYRTYTRADRDRAMAHAEGLRKWRIPCDMFGLEPGWQTHA